MLSLIFLMQVVHQVRNMRNGLSTALGEVASVLFSYLYDDAGNPQEEKVQEVLQG
jgi:hypothetical protein